MGATASFMRRQESTRPSNPVEEDPQNPPPSIFSQRPIIRSRSNRNNIQFQQHVCQTCERRYRFITQNMRCPSCHGNLVEFHQRSSPRLLIGSHHGNRQHASFGGRRMMFGSVNSNPYRDEGLRGIPMNNEEILFNLVYFASSEAVGNREERDRVAKSQAMTDYIHSLSDLQSRSLPVSSEIEKSPIEQEGDTNEKDGNIESEECSICAEIVHQAGDAQETVRLPECGHYFHLPCVLRWLVDGNPTCPVCRSTVIPSKLFHNPDNEMITPVATPTSTRETVMEMLSTDAAPDVAVVASPSMITSVTLIQDNLQASSMPTAVAQLT